ncbi:MAG: toprim domain-containing protein, partial [Candidatus Neomarinimicrobiota bacterium]|nr:toprim domain-containing protein [Candidatus Neomarinimicrobiota bacterium]
MSNIATYIDQLIEALTKLPGIGRKGAERIAYFIIHSNDKTADDIVSSLEDIGDKLETCENCGMIFLKKDEECSCSSASNTKHICVVENIEDAIKIQNTHSYDGLYHVLGGAISPLDGIGP